MNQKLRNKKEAREAGWKKWKMVAGGVVVQQVDGKKG